jgi:hypothetical protein
MRSSSSARYSKTDGWRQDSKLCASWPNFSERQNRAATRVARDTIRAMRHGRGVKRSNFLRENERRASRLSQGKPKSFVLTGYGYTVHGARIEQSICFMPYRDPAREQPGCGNTASGSAGNRRVCPCLRQPHLLSLSLFYVAAGRRAHSRFQPNA